MTAATTEHASPASRAAAAAGVAAALLLVLALAWFDIASTDLGYHLAYGRHFLDTGRIVDRDPFIYASPDDFFVNANWAWQVLVSWFERRGGVSALIASRLVFIAIAFSAAVWLARRRGASWAVVAPLLVLAGVAAHERFDLRPELASYALGMIQLCLVVAPPRRVVVACAATFVVQVMWVNMHSYFLVGPLAAMALFVGDGLRWRWTREAEAARLTKIRAAMLLAQLAACLVNPWGIAGALFPLRTLGLLKDQGVLPVGQGSGAGAWSGLDELVSPFASLPHPICPRAIYAYFLALAVAAWGLIAAVKHGRLGEALAILLLAAMSMTMRRNIALFAIAALPIAAAAIEGPWSRRSIRWAGPLIALLAAAWWIPRIWTGRFYGDDQRLRTFGAGLDPFVFPVDACAFVRARPALQPRLFADFFPASNVLPLLPAGSRVFIDTNTFAYPPEALATMAAVTSGAQPYAGLFEAESVNVVLLHVWDQTRELIGRLAADGQWALAYVDPAFVIFVRRIPAHAELLASLSPSPDRLDVDLWIVRAHQVRLPTGGVLAMFAEAPLSLGWYGPAVRLLERAVEVEPGLAAAWENLGAAHVQLAVAAQQRGEATEVVRRELLAARNCFVRTLRLEPQNDAAQQGFGFAQGGLDSIR